MLQTGEMATDSHLGVHLLGDTEDLLAKLSDRLTVPFPSRHPLRRQG